MPKPLTAVGWRNGGECEREIGRNEGEHSSFHSSEWPLLTQEHFVQLGYCLTADSVTLSGACSQNQSDGKEKRQNWSLLSRLLFSSPEFIPENCTSCIIFLSET